MLCTRISHTFVPHFPINRYTPAIERVNTIGLCPLTETLQLNWLYGRGCLTITFGHRSFDSFEHPQCYVTIFILTYSFYSTSAFRQHGDCALQRRRPQSDAIHLRSFRAAAHSAAGGGASGEARADRSDATHLRRDAANRGQIEVGRRED